MRLALVTGGSRGIGYAIAKALDDRGWGLFLVNRDPARSASATTLENVIGNLSLDLGAGESAAVAVRSSVQQVTPKLDLVVLNAGIFIEEPLTEVDSSSFQRNMNVNLDANVFLARELLPLLRRGTKPRIIVIGSTAAYEAYPLVPTYGIAKWALRGFALNLRHELMSERIGVTLLSPGGTLTDMWAGEDLEPNRLLRPEDIAQLVVSITELSEQAVVEEVVVRPMLGDIHE